MTTPENSPKREFSPHWHPPYDPPRGVVIDGFYDPELRESMRWKKSDLPRWLVKDTPKSPGVPEQGSSVSGRHLFKALAIAICATLLGLALPGFDTLDYWVGMAAFLTALLVVATL